MRRLAPSALLAAALLVAACSLQNRFEVVVIDPGATGARLELCGRAPEALPRTGQGFELRRRSDCRGGGQVVVSFADGRTVACPIRFVDASVEAWYRYRVEGGRCVIF